jgi:crotonobetainyl-CoA:carnitine CoA-transferase CaiB-like acyl-CoA transferase
VPEVGGEIAAAYATKLLCDLGAEVVKLEPPAGDPLRESPGLFRYLNRGKRSAFMGEAAGLIDGADIVVESLGPGRLETDGPGVPTRGALVRISDFGQHGPYRDLPMSPLVLQAMSGWVSPHGIPDRDPVQVGGRLPEYVAGAFAGCAALTAWRATIDLGRLVTVDLSVMECLVGTLAYPMLFDLTLKALGLPPPEARYSVLPGIVRCADGWAGINALTGQHWQDICTMLDADEFRDAQRELGWGGELLDRFFAHVQPALDARTVEEIVELSQAFRIPAAPVGDGKSLPQFAQFKQRHFFVHDDVNGTTPGPPYRLAATPAEGRGEAPVLASGPAAWEDRGSSPRGTTHNEPYRPFVGLRVVDLGTFWAGPYVGAYLGSMGADVIKVESFRRPDGFRFSAAFPQEGADWYERSGLWQATNLNKQGITLELDQRRGIDLLERLIAGAGVVIENFSARVLDQFGLTYDRLAALAPGLIMVRMPGFGLEGPWRDYVGWAMGFEQACGMARITGDEERPLNPGGFLDPVVGMHTALALQAALHHRERTGEGQLIEVAQVETGACLTADQVLAYSLRGEVLRGHGNHSDRFAPQGVYRCRDAETGRASRRQWVALTVRSDADWERLVAAIGRTDWVDRADLAGLTGRHSAGAEIDAGITAWTAERTPADVVERLREVGLPVAGLLRAEEMYDDPQLVARGYYEVLDHPRTGPRRYPAWPMQFSFLPGGAHRRPAPTLGQHNDEVLGGVLGLTAAQLEELRAEGVIGERMPA